MDWNVWSDRWGVDVSSAEQMAKLLRRQLADTFRVDMTFADLMRPGRTGQILLERTGVDLLPLPEDLQLLISSTACQHRIEFFRRSGDISSLHKYDCRLAYAGCCKGLGVAGGRWSRIEGEDIRPEERGRARIRFRAPRGWSHIGLFACQDDEGGWVWPRHGETWADLSEIRFAREHDWLVHVDEKLVWPEDRPLDLWADRLGRLYLKAKEAKNDALAGCIRAVCLHTIGRFHNLGFRTETVEVPDGDARATIRNVCGVSDNGVLVKERRRTGKPAQHVHPEWSAAIWSRMRLRVSRACLSLPADSLHAIYGDAIYTSIAGVDGCEGWHDDGAVGRFRLTRSWPGLMAAPRNWAELHRLEEIL